jgi:inner membrane protein
MDSLTQLTLGAAVGEATLGRQVGRKATLWGAALGTLPDLDVLANPFLTEVQALAFHRSLTHSILFVVVMTPLLGLLLRRLHPDDLDGDAVPWTHWAGLVFGCLATHVLLDCLTTYGTQVFWPVSDYPVIFGTIFIIDPLYTVPLAGGLLTALWWNPTDRTRRIANGVGLAVSTLYLVLTIGNKLWVEAVFENSLRAQGLPHQEVFTKATAFNNVLWSGVAKGEDGFYVGFYSLLDDDTRVDVRFVPHNHELLKEAGAWDSEPVRELRRFSKGYFTVSRAPDGQLSVHDLRFGRSDLGLTRSGRYIFTFRLTRGPDGRVTGFTRPDPQVEARRELLRRFVRRIGGDEQVVRHES